MNHTHPHHHLTRFGAGMRVVVVSMCVNLSLTVLQVVVGYFGNSQALIADGFHTLSDLVSDFMVLFALVQSRKGADEEHPYGHARIETAVTLLLGIVLIAVGIGIVTNASLKLLRAQTFVAPSTVTLWIALGTLAAKEAMFRYTMHVARRYSSNMLRASAWHHRSDAISSLVVVAGIGGALIGFSYLDSVAAIVVSLMIAKIGGELGWQALRELIDTGLSHDELERIRATVMDVPGVRALHMLRTRKVGDHALADVHIVVDEHVSVSEGHQIGEAVRAQLIKDFEPIQDVTVHVDTEEDADGTTSGDLPLRDEVIRRLQNYFADIPEAHRIERVMLHYRRGRIVVEVVLPRAAATSDEAAKRLRRRLHDAATRDPQIESVSVLFR